MSKGRGPTPFPDEKNRIRVFDKDKLKKRFANMVIRGQKAEAIRRLIENTGKDENTVKGWIYGKHGPKDIEKVHIIEKTLGFEHDELLKYVEEEKEMGETRDIRKAERKAARRLYKKMNEMICSVRYDFSDAGPHDPPKPEEKMIEAMKYITYREYNGLYYDEIILAIRSTALDLPEKVRNECTNLFYDIVGKKEWDNLPVFGTSNYEEFLKETNDTDNDFARVAYTLELVDKSYERLDEIFKEYIKK
ncbi:MAG: hypothetical protein K6F35_12645 [Lachnospiraceae bacterium]|nr:hypothetical protein [Lachnospiraceae bacterium]